ncbi:MAG: penicillin-binding transpeptidase domain-containing protein [Acidimicrobiia bacterium]
MSDNSRVRVSIVGVVVVVLFSTLLARLWFLQSGPDDSLKVQAVVDSTRVIQTDNPRGEILDSTDEVLVKDTASWAVTLDRNLSKSTAARVLGQLAEQLKLPVASLESQYTSDRQSPLEPAVVAFDVSQPDRLAILQDQEDYPGVHVVELTVRAYPALDSGEDAAQLLGYVGEVDATELETLKTRGYQPGDDVGQAGAEAAFESVLRGTPRRETIEVDPSGQQVGSPVSVDPGSVGDNVYLTINASVQRAAETSLEEGILSARLLQNVNVKDRYATLKAPAGAAIVLNADTGAVVADASYPTYPPGWWVGGISTADYDVLNNPTSNQPWLNRATEGQYAPGSTFKLVTALAMTKYGIRSVSEPFNDTGSVSLDGTTYTNANSEPFGTVDLQQALTVSSDAYFYTVGNDFWDVWKAGGTRSGLGLQTEARELGFGAATGFELDEQAGLVQDPAWVKAFADDNYKTKAAQLSHSIWYPFDDIYPAVGQDIDVTPLQLANAYAAFANGGTLWQPQIEEKVVNAQGKQVQTIAPKAIRQIDLDPTTRAAMLAGFEGAVNQGPPAEGTAYQAFQGFPLAQYPVAGKTGTAQVAGKGDTSLFVAMFGGTAENPKYVAVVVVEQAGYGAQTAAPIARRIIEAMDGLPAPTVAAINQGHD